MIAALVMSFSFLLYFLETNNHLNIYDNIHTHRGTQIKAKKRKQNKQISKPKNQKTKTKIPPKTNKKKKIKV